MSICRDILPKSFFYQRCAQQYGNKSLFVLKLPENFPIHVNFFDLNRKFDCKIEEMFANIRKNKRRAYE